MRRRLSNHLRSLAIHHTHQRTPPRRLLALTALATLLGIAGGGAAWVLLHLIGLITNLAMLGQWDWSLPSFAHLQRSPRIVIVAVLGGLLVALLARWAPTIKGHGIPEAMEAVLTKRSRIQPRTAVAKPASAAVAIGTGGPFGAEGPIIVTGGALGSLLGQVLSMSPSERKILLASGAAAGMAATFGTPLAAVILAIELLLFEFSSRAFIPLVVASAIAAGMHDLLLGHGPLFSVPTHDFAGLDQLPLFVVLGVACGGLAIVICHGLFLVEEAYRRLPVREFWHPVIGGCAFALIGIAVPRVLGVGYDVIDDVLNDRLALPMIAVIVVAKLLAWWLALGSGTSGGTLAPVLLISGGFGSLVGALFAHLMPGAELAPAAFALVAMAATFGASTGATFAAIVFVFELTQDYDVILPLMVATVVADFIAGAALRDRLMTEKLQRRGLRVHRDYEPDIYRSTLVCQIMTTSVATLHAGSTVGEAETRLRESHHSALPLVDHDGRCRAMVTADSVLDCETGHDTPIEDVVAAEFVFAKPDDTALTALHLLVDEVVVHLPILDDDARCVGMVTHMDLLRARAATSEHEQSEPGWARRPKPV
jgi:H+/Cl- antiporter ClcA